MRYRQIYNIWGLYSGPAPATGFHYADYASQGSNNPQLSIFDENLLKQIDRVNNFTYNFNIERTNLTQLGVRSLVDRLVVNRPSVQVNFNYWIAGVRNEARLGFVVNYPDITGKPVLDEEINFLKNFTGKETDSRNLFVAVKPDDGDLNQQITDQFTPFDNTQGIDPSGLFVFGFGNCYLNSYRVHAAVGELPQVSVGYVCDNVMAYSSGSGVPIPAVLPKTGNLVPNITFTIPRAESIISPSVIKPSDITVQIGDITTTPVPNNSYDYINLFNISTALYNKIQLSGNLGNETLIINNSSTGDQYNFSGIYLKNNTTNNYNRIISSGTNNNQVLIIYSGVTGITGVNVFDSIYLKNISNNNYEQIRPTGAVAVEHLVINNPIEIFDFTPIDNALFGVSSSGLPIQSFDFTINLEREDLKSIGYILPIDRRVNFPILAEFNISSIIGNNTSGSLVDILNRNQSYDILVNMYNPSCNFTGREIAVQYKIKNAKLETLNYTYDLSTNLVGNFGFTAEIDIDNPYKAIYVSGLLNMPFPEFPFNYLRLQDNKTGFLFTEDNNLLIVSDNLHLV